VAYRDRKNRTKYRLDCVGKNGQVREIPVGDLIKNAVPEILDNASEAGVSVSAPDD
jgi:hypothetical protein